MDSREKILTAAKRLFVEQGYHGLSMRQLSEEVGISKAGIYHHFSDKEELFVAILSSYLDDMEALIHQAEQEGETVREQISLIVRRILAQRASQRAVIRLASQEMSNLSDAARRRFNAVYYQKFIGRLEAIMRAGIDAGELRALPPMTVTWSLLGMLYPYFYPAHSHDVEPSDETIEQLLTIYFDGASARTDPEE